MLGNRGNKLHSTQTTLTCTSNTKERYCSLHHPQGQGLYLYFGVVFPIR